MADWMFWSDTWPGGPPHRRLMLLRCDRRTWHRDRFDPVRRRWVHIPGRDRGPYAIDAGGDWFRCRLADVPAVMARMVAAASAE